MNTIKNTFSTQVSRIRNWWTDNREHVIHEVRQASERLGIEFDIIITNITRLMIIGIILNVVAVYFYPDFPEKFPVIYGWFNSWLQFGEFAIKAAFSGIYALFTGNWSEFWTEYTEAFREALQYSKEWMSALSF